MDQYMKRIPTDVGNEIFNFLIPDIDQITFRKVCPRSSYAAYSDKYETAFINNQKITDPTENIYLSRIPKPNGKHRYYITKELVDSIEIEHNDRCIEIYHYEYVSTYVGKDIRRALLQLI
jgi:hypothetical protein